MADDFFGYAKESYDSNSIASSNMVVVSITGGTGSSGGLCLVQSADISYQRTVTPVFELGSDSVWLVAGGAQGSANLQRILGKRGGDGGQEQALEAFKPSDPCTGVTITMAEGNGKCGLKPGKITCENSILNNITASVQVGQLTLNETAAYTVGKVSIG